MRSAGVRFELREGSLRVRGVAGSLEIARAAAQAVGDASRAGRPLSLAVELAGRGAWIKGDHLPGTARWRHSLARAFGARPPAVREHAALAWLRARLFRAPEPLAAGVVVRSGWLRYQFIATERIQDAAPLERAWTGADEAQRRRWLAELAREAARMHALHFVHRDLFLRNVLARIGAAPLAGDPRALTFVDVRRGGSPRPGRDAAYDLACLLLEGASLLTPEEQVALLEVYVEERRALGRPVGAAAFTAAIAGRRAALVRRIDREPGRWRLPVALVREWSGPGCGAP